MARTALHGLKGTLTYLMETTSASTSCFWLVQNSCNCENSPAPAFHIPPSASLMNGPTTRHNQAEKNPVSATPSH